MIAAPSTLHRLIGLIQSSLKQASGKTNFEFLSHRELEDLGILIHEAMSGRGRKYHTVDHIFGVAENMNPIQILAAVFHDLVYLQVDRRIHPKVAKYLPEFTSADRESVFLPLILEGASDPSLSWVASIFGFQSEQHVGSHQGANEFLSALVAVRVLRRLDFLERVQIAACIEMTIPFRTMNSVGMTPAEQLKERLEGLISGQRAKTNPIELASWVNQAVELANRDVSGFSFDDPGKFLMQTWDLILEGNPVFRNPLYTVRQYRQALLKMDGFFNQLDPGAIFVQKLGEKALSGEAEAKARKNLEVAKEYVQAKLLSIGVLEAIAKETGGDVPLILFMGASSEDSGLYSVKIEDYLNSTFKEHESTQWDIKVSQLLKQGLPREKGKSKDFDFKNSSLAAYLYPRLSSSERIKYLQFAREFFQGNRTPWAFLKEFRREIVCSILDALLELTSTRRELLNKLQSKINSLD